MAQYVTLDENDFKKVPLKTTHAIDIVGFVESREIDPIYYRDSYYLEPESVMVSARESGSAWRWV